MLAASDISDARLEWPPGRDEGTAGTAGTTGTTGTTGANRTDSASRARGEGSVVGGRGAGGFEEDEEEEDCRW